MEWATRACGREHVTSEVLRQRCCVTSEVEILPARQRCCVSAWTGEGECPRAERGEEEWNVRRRAGGEVAHWKWRLWEREVLCADDGRVASLH